MKRNDLEKYLHLLDERAKILDYVIARLKKWRLIWSVPVSIVLFSLGGIFLGNFESALTHSEAIAKGYPPFPSSWEAGVFNHGSFFQWYLAETHPILYAASWIMCLGSYLFMLALLLIFAIDWLRYQYRKTIAR